MKKKITLIIVVLVGMAVVSVFLVSGNAAAQLPDSGQAEKRVASAPLPEPGVSNDYCLSCHAQPDLYTELASGEQLYLTIDEHEFYASVHGAQGYACVQCHTEIREYPHPPISAPTRRDLVLELYLSCKRCHHDKYDSTLDSVHGRALASGNKEAAVCTDCHGAHNVRPPNEPRSHIPQTCDRCHSEIYKEYQESVHGAALIGDGNPDVPSCTDCHGVHNVAGPSDAGFHLNSPLICASCHQDQELMAKYGLSADVFDTYVSDFHGTTVVMFEANIPGQETNKPVCTDCHGVHNIRSAKDPQSNVYQTNLLATCQRCHPGATENFPTSWLGHYRPDIDRYPIVYIVDLFYRIFVPTVLGGMAILVAADAGRRVYNRIRKEH